MTLSQLRTDAISIFNAGLEAVDPYVAIKKALKIRENILEIGGKIRPLKFQKYLRDRYG